MLLDVYKRKIKFYRESFYEIVNAQAHYILVCLYLKVTVSFS